MRRALVPVVLFLAGCGAGAASIGGADEKTVDHVVRGGHVQLVKLIANGGFDASTRPASPGALEATCSPAPVVSIAPVATVNGAKDAGRTTWLYVVCGAGR